LQHLSRLLSQYSKLLSQSGKVRLYELSDAQIW
jgi:hypothetical protein